MKLSKNSKTLIAMAEHKGMFYVSKDSKNPHVIMHENGNIYCQANTQKELIDKMKSVFFENELNEIYESIK